MTIWNPHSLGPTGVPVGLVAPAALRVVGGPATAGQLAAAQAAFYKFCMNTRVSRVPNPTEVGRLPDGSAYRIVVVGNTATMLLHPAGGDVDADCGIFINANDNADRYLLKHQGTVGNPTGVWKVKRTEWDWTQYVSPQTFGWLGLMFSGAFVVADDGRSWHSPTTKEYIAAGGTDTTRLGAMVISGRHAGLVGATVLGEARFMRLDGTGAGIVARTYGRVSTEPVPAAGETLPRALDLLSTDVVRTAERAGSVYETIAGASLNGNGTAALISVYRRNYDSAVALPGGWYEQPGWFADWRLSLRLNGISTALLVEFDALFPAEPGSSRFVDEFLRSEGGVWAKERGVTTPAVGSCIPAKAEFRPRPGDLELYEVRKYMQWDAPFPDVVVPESTACVWVGPDSRNLITPNVLIRSVHGPLQYREWREAESTDAVQAAWYSKDGSISSVSRWWATKIERSITGQIDNDNWGNWYCFITGNTGDGGSRRVHRAHNATTVTTNIIESGITFRGEKFITSSSRYSETHSHVYSYEVDDYPDPTTGAIDASGDISISVSALSRNVFVADPHLDVLFYIESECSYTLGASAIYQERGTAYDIINQTDDRTVTATGASGVLPDFAIPQRRLVLECRGNKFSFDIGYDSEECPDIELRWHMRPINSMASVFADDITRRGLDAAQLAFNASSRIAKGTSAFINTMFDSSATEGLRLTTDRRSGEGCKGVGYGAFAGPILDSGDVTVNYAKDPKTGAAVLWLRAHGAHPRPGLPVAFAIDKSGARPLTDIIQGLSVPSITVVSPA